MEFVLNEKKKILVVDDDMGILSLFTEAFKKNYQVYSSDNGEDALEIVENNHFNVILIDIQMPGMTGTELCKEIREFNKTSWIYAITGLSPQFEIVDEESSTGVGFDGRFYKPLKMEKIIQVVNDSCKLMRSSSFSDNE